MTEFNTLPILEGLEPDDRLPCTDASTGRDLKQLPVSTLLSAIAQLVGNGPIAATATAPNPADKSVWLQVDSEGLMIGEWIPSPDRARWLSRQTWTVGYSETGGYKSWFQAGNPIPGDVWIESIYVSCLSDGDFNGGQRRDIQVNLFDETGAARSFVTKQITGLSDGQRLADRDLIGVVKPLSECLYFQMRGVRVGNAPKVKFFTVSLTLRWAYDTQN
ncbi:MAG: hypothetical protein AAF827_03890 [Cyanobacteria bacterium P01_D01_bin.6]